MAIYYAAEILLFAFIYFGVTKWIYVGVADRDPPPTPTGQPTGHGS